MTVLAGTNDLRNGGTYYHVEKFILHPRFSRNSDPRIGVPNDIALVKINGKIDFSQKVRSIDLAVENVPVGTPLVLSKFKIEISLS